MSNRTKRKSQKAQRARRAIEFPGVGRGRGRVERDPIDRQRSPWIEVTDQPEVASATAKWAEEGGGSREVRVFVRRVHDGALSAIRSLDAKGWHLSLSWEARSARQARRYPTWVEIAHAREELLDADVGFAMLLPPNVAALRPARVGIHLHEHPARESASGPVVAEVARVLARERDLRAERAIGVEDFRVYWNGEPALAQRVRVMVPEWREGDPPAAWWRPHAGEVHAAVFVEYHDQRHLLDDEDGSGWTKVTEGHGSPAWPHRDLPLRSEVVS